jgi:predicted HicB family RNase H-like nuclease
MMEYKGYVGRSEVNEEAGLIFGEVIGLRDVITYQGKTTEEARRSFEESIDLYLETCAEEGIDPDKPYSGNLLIRTKAPIHRALVALAKTRGQSLNTLIDSILSKAVRKARTPSPSLVSGKTAKLKATSLRDVLKKASVKTSKRQDVPEKRKLAAARKPKKRTE